MNIVSIARGQGAAPSRTAVGPTFGLARDQGKRIEITFALKNGGGLTTVEEMDESLSDELLQGYSEQLARDVAAGSTRTFADGIAASGQRAWINLGEVVAFSVRPAK